jgi:hypothetical protein
MVRLLLKQLEAAEALSLSVRSLERMRCQGGGPKYVRLSRGRIAYREEDLRVDCTQGRRKHKSTVTGAKR